MDPEQLKTHINAALQPLLQRIKALEDENQEIKAILKNIPQPKVPTKPATTPTTGNTTSVKKIPPPTKGHDADKKAGDKKEGAKIEQEKKSEHNQHHQNHPEHAEGEGKTQNTPANQKKQPGAKPTTAANNKKPNPTQPDPKKPAQTPHADKKTPGTTTGRVSTGADKGQPKGVAKVKTETAKQEQGKKEQESKHENKQEQKKQQNGETHAEHKQATTGVKDDKSKQKKGPTKPGAHGVHDKPVHGKPADHKNQKDKPPTGAKPKPGAGKQTHVVNSNSKKNLTGGAKKVEQSPKQEKVQQKSQPASEVAVVAEVEQKKQPEQQAPKQPAVEEPAKEVTEVAQVVVQQVSKSDQQKAESGPVAEPQQQAA